MSNTSEFDRWTAEDGPAALVLRQALVPVEGKDGVFFPATFAASEDKTFKGGYNIDSVQGGKGNVCLVDSVGSQANRIEPVFLRESCRDLVPQIVIEAGEVQVNLLEAGHRAADAVVRCSDLRDELNLAFREVRRGNAEELARIAPTSLVFGAWDSRDTQAKLPRVFASTIRAYDVDALTRSAQFVPALDYIESGVLAQPESQAAKNKHSERGFIHVPASAQHGGVIARGEIRREATVSLGAIRLLTVREKNGNINIARTDALRRYVLGLALVALTAPGNTYLRQGCNLVPDVDGIRTLQLVHSDGKREDIAVTFDEALAYATSAAKAFGVGENRTVKFDSTLAQAEIDGDSTAKKKGKKAVKSEKQNEAPISA